MLPGDKSNTEKVGYVIFGSSTNGGPDDANRLPNGTPGSEILDLGPFVAMSAGMKEGGSPADFLKEGSKLKDVIERAENQAIKKIQKALEVWEKVKEEDKSTKKRKKAFQNWIALFVPLAKHRQDKNHVDKNNDPGTWERLKHKKKTDHAQDSTSNNP